VNLNTTVVKRKLLDVGRGLKSSFRKREHLNHAAEQTVEFVDDGSGDSGIVPNKKLLSELSTSAATSIDTGLVTSVTFSVNGTVANAESESLSNTGISSSVPYASLITSHTVESDVSAPGTAAVTSSSTGRAKTTEEWRIRHLKFSSGRDSSAKHVASVTNDSQKQATFEAGHPARIHSNETTLCSAQQNTITDGIYLFWPNVDSLCWLDAAMALLVNCESLRGISTQLSSDSCLGRLLQSFNSAQVNFRRSRKLYRCHYLCGQGKAVTLETSVGQVAVKTGGGRGPLSAPLLGRESTVIASIDLDDISSIVSPDDPHSTSVEMLSHEARRLEDRAKQLMTRARDEVFENLQLRMQCERGEGNAVLMALAELLSIDEPVKSHFTVHYTFSLPCTSCRQSELGT